MGLAIVMIRKRSYSLGENEFLRKPTQREFARSVLPNNWRGYTRQEAIAANQNLKLFTKSGTD